MSPVYQRGYFRVDGGCAVVEATSGVQAQGFVSRFDPAEEGGGTR